MKTLYQIFFFSAGEKKVLPRLHQSNTNHSRPWYSFQELCHLRQGQILQPVWKLAHFAKESHPTERGD